MVTPWNLKRDVSRVHMVGISGFGMPALARFCAYEGMVVSGSDQELSTVTKDLINDGVSVSVPYSMDNIPKDIQLVVYADEVHENNVELLASKSCGVPVLSYSTVLGRMVNDLYLIAVSGTKDRVLTISILTDIMDRAGMEPTVLVGDLDADSSKKGFRPGKSKYAIVEACEYKEGFLHLQPNVLAITSVDYKYSNYLDDQAYAQSLFSKFSNRLHLYGDRTVVADLKDSRVSTVLSGSPVEVVDCSSYIDRVNTFSAKESHIFLCVAVAMAVASVLKIEDEVVIKSLENLRARGLFKK